MATTSSDHRPTVTLTREQREAVRGNVWLMFTDNEIIGNSESAVRATARRIDAAIRLFDGIGWEDDDDRDVRLVVDDQLAEFAQHLRERTFPPEIGEDALVIEVAEIVRQAAA